VKLRERKLIASNAMWVGHCPAERQETRWHLTYGRQEQLQHITLWLTGLINLDSIIDKHQISVLSTTCDPTIDAVSDCLNTDRVHRHFLATSFFLIAATVNILNDYLSPTVLNGYVLHGNSLHTALQHGDFQAVLWRIWGVILHTALREIHCKVGRWKTLKTGQHLAKLEARVEWHLIFFQTWCSL